MNNPSGYTALDLVGYTDQGDYDAIKSYVANDLVHYGGSIWCCLIDDTTGITPTEGVNWRFWVENSQNGISDIVNVLGAKNLLNFVIAIKNGTGITFTRNSDGSITVNGTAENYNQVQTTKFTLKEGKYILSTTELLQSNFYVQIFDETTLSVLTFVGNSVRTNVEFEINNELVTHFFIIRIVVPTGTIVDNVTVYPMIRPKNIEDATWQPYAKTNKELTAEVTQNSSDIQTLTNNVTTNTTAIQTLTNQVSTNTSNISANATAIQTLSNKVSNSSDSYDSTKAYSVGELVIHDNALYKCITACSAAAWSVNQSCFTQDTLTNVTSQLNQNLTYKLQGTVTGTTAISYPSTWNEAIISITYTSNVVTEYSFHIIKKDVENLGSSNYKFYRSGFGVKNLDSLGESDGCILASTGTFIVLNTLFHNGTDYINSASVTMYYR